MKVFIFMKVNSRLCNKTVGSTVSVVKQWWQHRNSGKIVMP